MAGPSESCRRPCAGLDATGEDEHDPGSAQGYCEEEARAHGAVRRIRLDLERDPCHDDECLGEERDAGGGCPSDSGDAGSTIVKTIFAMARAKLLQSFVSVMPSHRTANIGAMSAATPASALQLPSAESVSLSISSSWPDRSDGHNLLPGRVAAQAF